MRTRLDLARTSVLPFQYPSLKGYEVEPTHAEAPVPVDIDAFGEMPPETDAAEDTVDAAEEQAAAIAAELARGHAEGFEQGFAEGREQGYAAGFAEGVTVGEASLADQARRLASVIGRLGEPIASLEEPVEEAVAALALEVARCVIGDEVNRSREFLAGLVREAIAKVPIEMGVPRVLLNPVDLELIRRLVPEIDAGSATLVADDTVEAGGCLVVADGDERPVKDRRWDARTAEGVSQVNLTLPSRWRAVMLTLFDGENE